MRRSKHITLVALATVSCLALSACDDSKSKDTEVMGDFYNTVQDCIDAKDPNDTSKSLYTADQCKAQFSQAEAEHAKNAPKFGSKEECEAQFGPGACGTTPVPQAATAGQPSAPGSTTIINNTTTESGGGGGGSFMPFMMGYMFGHASSPPTPVYYGPGTWRDNDRDNRPLYASGGSFYNGNSRSKPLGYVERDVGGYKETLATPSNTTGGRPQASAVNSSINRNGFSPGKFSARSSAFGSPATRAYSPPVARSGGFGGLASSAGRSIGASTRGGFGGMSASHGSMGG